MQSRLGRVLVAVVLGASSALVAVGAPSSPTVALRARSFRPGELVVVSVTAPPEAALVRVRAFGQELPAHRTRPGVWRALLGIDLDQAPGAYDVSAEVDGAVGGKSVQVVPKTFAVRTLRVNPDFVNPPEELAERLAEEARFLEGVYAAAIPEPLWSAPFRRPVPHKANSRFGTRSIFNGEPRTPHGGTDFLSPAGTPVRAPNAGRVVAARELFFAGRTVILDHGGGLFSQLAHLSRIDAHEGEMVDAGQIVGRVGATGRVTGAHLHWAVRVSGARVDALSLLALLGTPPTPAP